MDIEKVLDDLGNDDITKNVVSTLKPFLPSIKREGKAFYDDVLAYAIGGKWTELDRMAWGKMTDDERDALSDTILADARDAVDHAFEREKLAREVAFKIASSLLSMLL